MIRHGHSTHYLPFALALAFQTILGCGSGTDPVSNEAYHAVRGLTIEAGSNSQPAEPEQPITFNEHIRPILSENCFFCHGPDPSHREADLRLDTFAGATEDFGGYAAVVPGDRESSELWTRITATRKPMPPVDSHKSLTDEQIELLGRWIEEGAAYEEHWAYVVPTRPTLPGVDDEAWPINPIDRFVLARLEAVGVAPSAQADRLTLIRRVTLDLTGLPPTPEQVERFLADDSPDAYESYVDELLADERYGEHMAVWWLDLVRYADTVGFHGDQPRSVWPYRDWVIASLNANMPFDEFSRLQLAGDLLADEPTLDHLIPSAYNRLAPQTREGGAQPKEYAAIYNADRVTNFGDVWLGSSVGCAQCHDHKYDPFTTRDFYAIAAAFADINHAQVGTGGAGEDWPPFAFVPRDDAQRALVEANESAYRQVLREQPDAMYVEEHVTSYDPKPPLPGDNGAMPPWGGAFVQLVNERAGLADRVPIVSITRALPEPRVVRILPRGNWQDDTGEIVLPAGPAFLGAPASTPDRRLTRLDIADWLFDEANPLTARVVVNRLWARAFGHGLSGNLIDLGSQGRPPTHPRLLDWLALEFRDSGWDLKHMIKLIVTSQTYRQSSDARGDLADIDPNNTRLFARQTSKRLSAEAIRDQALFVSGLLTPGVGGPSVFPYQPDGHWDALNFPRRSYPTSTGEDLYRPSVYTWVQRSFPHPAMVTFDAPTREVCSGQRLVSTTPLQALTLLNGTTYVEAARVLAQRITTEQADDHERIDLLFRLVLCRPPTAGERDQLTSLLDRQRVHFTQHPGDAAALTNVGAAPVRSPLPPEELAAWTSLCRVVLNLHETITRE